MKLCCSILMVICFGLVQIQGLEKWTTLEMTFKKWHSMPTNSSQMKSSGWVKMFRGCSSSEQFPGDQYMHPNYDNLILITDKRGTIAGIQTLVPEKVTEYNADYCFTKMPFYVKREGLKHYALTVYLVDPTTICNEDTEVVNSQGFGNADYLTVYQGEMKNPVKLPRHRSQLGQQSGWYQHKCIPGMGIHGYFDICEDTSNVNCRELFPITGLYDPSPAGTPGSGELMGFVFSHVIDHEIYPKEFPLGNLWEVPPFTIYNSTIDCADQLVKEKKIVNMHVYFRGHNYACA